MAKFISISGPSTTGKTSLIDSLSTHKEMYDVILSPDMHDVVWNEMVQIGHFSEFSEILSDSDYLCTYMIRLIDHYNEYMDRYEDEDAIVLLDGCWLDFTIYAVLNMWYTRIIKSVQEEILEKIAKYDDRISRIYLTTADDEKYPVDKFRLRGKITTFRANRPLEIQYYKIARHLKNAMMLPSTDISESSLFIIEDMKNLGYIR